MAEAERFGQLVREFNKQVTAIVDSQFIASVCKKLKLDQHEVAEIFRLRRQRFSLLEEPDDILLRISSCSLFPMF